MKLFEFNYNGKKLPLTLEESNHIDTFVKVKMAGTGVKFLLYYIDTTLDRNDLNKDIVQIVEPVIFLLISTGNSAHSISEIISFLDYYNNCLLKHKIIISKNVIALLPLLWELICLFIPLQNIIILNEDIIYKCSCLTTHRNHHFNYTKNWSKIPFNKVENVLYFKELQYIKNDFLTNTNFLFDKVENIYNEHRNSFQLFNNIMFIKTKNDVLSSTLHRSIDNPSESIKNLMSLNNIHFININDFKNIFEYICVFYHAKNIIVSYGGPCCTNRFFCNQNANIIVLANLHYKPEYEFNNENNEYWHVRHSHLYPVESQFFLLDFENTINEDNFNKILNFLK